MIDQSLSRERRIGIDASNTGSGGVLTHLSQLLRATDPRRDGVDRVVVWGSRATLEQLDDQPWLERVHVRALDDSLPRRVAWQQLALPLALRDAGCALLFSPGGSLPYRLDTTAVCMSRNLLPFEAEETMRFGVSWRTAKMRVLRHVHGRSFRRARGVIFLTNYARRTIEGVIGPLPGESIVVPHGIEPQFFRPPAAPSAGAARDNGVFRLLYVSRVDAYKHQWIVAEAAARLRPRGVRVDVEFVGPAAAPSLARLNATIDRVDPGRTYLRYRGSLPHDTIHETYQRADAFVFASSCESLPNTLLEAMAAGLPIACSQLGPMSEVLGDAGVYFNPTDVASVAAALDALVADPSRRLRLATMAFERAQAYSWERCAIDTWAFVTRFLPRSI